MIVLDIIILALAAAGAWRGYKKGLLQEVVSILALVLAFIGSFRLLHVAIDMIDQYFEGVPELVPLFAFVLLFAVILFVVNQLGKAVKKTLTNTLLGSFDQLAGAIMGMLKALFLASLGIFVVDWLNDYMAVDISSGSYLREYVEPLAPFVINGIGELLPFAKDLLQDFKDIVQDSREQVASI